MAALDNIASELLKSANEADLIYKRTRDQAQRDKAVRLRRIVENLRNITLGASDLNGLSDVAISSPTNAQVLSYNSTTLKWQNTTISTATPTLAQVTTAGNTTTNAISTGNITVSASNTASLTLLDTLQPYSWQIRNNGTSLLFVNNSGNNLFRINANGNVLIGTNTDAGYKLDVNGTARVKTDLKIETGTGGLTIEGDASGYPTLSINTLRSGVDRRNWKFATEQINVGDFVFYRSSTGGGAANTVVYSVSKDGTVVVGGTTVVNMNYGQVPKLYVSDGTFLDGIIQLPTTLRIRASGGGINFQQQSEPSANSLLTFGNDSSGVYYGNYSSLGLRFLVNNVAQMTIASTTGNVLIGTTTDAGVKLDVVGSIRASSILFGSQITNTNSNPVIGSDGSNIGLGVNFASRIIMAGTNIDLSANSVSIARFASSNAGVYIGGAITPTAKLQVAGSITAASALAQGVFFNNTLVAAANNDVLVGLDINPTFTNGAFTGVANAALRVQGWSWATTGVTIGVNAWASGSPLNGFNLDQDGTYGRFKMGSGSGFGYKFFTNSTERLRIVDGNVMVLNTNMLVGTTTDAGYKLDVVGSGRVKGLDNSSSTTAFLVQNTGGWDNLKVTNDGQVSIGGDGLTTFPLRVYGNSGLQIQVGNALFSYNAVRTIRFLNANNGIPLNHEIVNQVSGTDNSNYVYFRNQTIQTAGSNADWTGISIETIVNTQTSTKVTQLLIKPTYNLQASTTSASIQRGIYYNPTITTLQTAIHRAIETTSGDVILNTQSAAVNANYTTVAIGGSDGVYFQMYVGPSPTSQNLRGQLWAVGNNLLLNNPTAGYLGLFTTLYSGITIWPTTGNVYVGASPSTDTGYKLDVAGTARVKGTGTTSSTVSLLVQNSTPTTLLQVEDGGTTRVTGPTPQLMVKVPSNQAPSSALTVGGNALFTYDGYSNAGGFYIDQGGTSSASRTIWYDGSGTPKNLITGNGDNYITSGNFGLGTTTPTDKIHIVDNTNGNKFARISAGGTDASAAWVAQNDQVDNIVYRVFGSAVTGSQMGQALARSASLIANLGGTGKFLIGSYSGTDLIFGTSDQARMRLVDATGNFLIGTMTDTGNKLTVSGNIDAQGYKVNNVLGYTGILNIPTNPPGQQNIDIQGGIVINIF